MEVYRRIGAGRLAEVFGESQVGHRLVRPDPGLARRRRARPRRSPRRTRPALPGRLRRRASTRYLDGHPNALRPAFVVAGALSGAGQRARRPPPRAVDAARHPHLGQGPGLGPGRQHGHRDLPDARRRPARRPGAHGPALPRLRPADQPVIAAAGVPGDGVNGGAAAPTGAAPARSATTMAATTPRPGPQLARLANGIPALAGLAPETGPRRRGRRRLEQLGRGPELTTTGSALLANDPHLGLDMPSVWYVNGLHCAPVVRRLRLRRRGRHLPGHAGRDRRPQRRHRVGRDQRQPRRPGPRRGAGRPGRSGQVPHRGRLRAVHRPHRDHPGRRRRTTSR